MKLRVGDLVQIKSNLDRSSYGDLILNDYMRKMAGKKFTLHGKYNGKDNWFTTNDNEWVWNPEMLNLIKRRKFYK